MHGNTAHLAALIEHAFNLESDCFGHVISELMRE